MTKRPQRPKFLWNNAYLEKLAIEMGDECIFLCLSPVSFRMLTDMTKMLLWATRYEEGIVSELGKTAYRELNVPCLEDLHALLEEIQLQNSDWLQSRFDDLGSRMTELEQMDINVNQTVNTGGCGCGDGGTTSTNTIDGVAIDPTDTATIPPYMTEQIELADFEKCRSANYLAAKVIAAIRTLGQIGDAGGGVVAVAAVVGYALTLISPVLGDEVIATAVILRWVYGIIALGESTDFIFEYFSDLANAMEGRTEELVCLLYDYNTASELGASLAGWIENMVEELRIQAGMSDVSASMLSSVLVNIFGSNVINYFVENVGTIVPADFNPQYDCTCGATGDTCPVENVVLAGVGNIPDGDLSGTMQAFASEFNSSTGYHEIIFELANNYCVSIDNATYTPDESHETCSGGVMVASDGSCIRRFVARSLAPFATAVDFKNLSDSCYCIDWSCLNDPAAEVIDIVPASLTGSGCPNVLVDSYGMIGDRFVMEFHTTAPACTTGIWTLKMPVISGLHAYLFEDLQVTSSTSIEIGDRQFVSGESGNFYVSAYTSWKACIASQGFTDMQGLATVADGDQIQFTVSIGGGVQSYTLSAVIKGVKTL